jgi:glycosyltransferase involved in cell wall biosynthesis
MYASPFFSIVIPVYNVEHFVAECISSVINQSFTDFEAIIIDDGSFDKSIDIIKEIAGNDIRIRIVSQKNSGLSAARNKGIYLAKGHYVFFLDSDDFIKLDTLKELKSILSKQTGIDLIAFGACPFLDETPVIKSEKVMYYEGYYSRSYLDEGIYKGEDYYKSMSSKRNFVASACLYISRLDIIKEFKLKFVEGIIREDEVFTRHLIQHAKLIYFSQSKFYHRRIRQGSITQTKISRHWVYSSLKVSKEVNQLYKLYGNKFLRIDAMNFYKNSYKNVLNYFKEDRALINMLICSPFFFESNIYKDVFSLRFPLTYNLWRYIKENLSSKAPL